MADIVYRRRQPRATTWAESNAAWVAYLRTVTWAELVYLADVLVQPWEWLEQNAVLQEMGKRYAASMGFPPQIWPGT